MVGKHWYRKKGRNSSGDKKERITMKKREETGIEKGEGATKVKRETSRERERERERRTFRRIILGVICLPAVETLICSRRDDR